jgi:DNA-binding transcriptional ArsR family regulator
LTSAADSLKLNLMVKYKDDVLNAVFAALADPTRRTVLQALEQGALSVGELAGPHGMSLPGFMKHLRVLEDAGLVSRAKDGRVVSLAIAPQPLQEAAVWLSRYEKFWSARLDAPGRYLYHQEELNPPCKAALPKTARRSTSAGTTKPRQKKSGAPGPTRKR